MGDTDGSTWDAFGAYLRSQRKLAQLSLRQLEVLTSISNPYLSQIERGLHQPSIGVVKALAEALDLSVREVLAHAAGIAADEEPAMSTEAAIRGDPRLDDGQKSALLAVYVSMVGNTPPAPPDPQPARGRAETRRTG
jgi:transcriptional regulator with XRE-family HTH domain